METGSSPDTGYNGAAVAGALIATFCFPLIAFITALLLQGNESDPRKKEQLRTWAWISGGWLALGVVFAVVVVLVTV